MDRGPGEATACRGLRLANPRGGAGESLVGLAPVWRLALLGALGLGLGSSAAWGGLYDVSSWGPAAIAVLAAALAIIVISPATLALPARLLLGALVSLAVLCALSMGWAQSPPAAAVEAHRWALYGATFLLAVKLVDGERARRVLLGLLLAGGLAVDAVLIAQLLGSGASSQFFSNRLMFPLGYVNGQAAALAAGVWPLLAVADQARHVALRGAAVAIATVLIGLMLLTQSRAGLAVLGVTAVVLVVLFPGRVHRAWLVLLVACAVAVVGGELTNVYSQAPADEFRPAAAVVNSAVAHLLIVGVAAGALWAGLCAAARRAPGAWVTRRVAGMALCAALLVVTGAGAIAVGHPVGRMRTQVDQFTKLDASGEGPSRLVSGGGNRYDFWRVAVEEFRAHPALGLGAGNYVTEYYARRHTTEAVRQPHSLPLQELAELGIGGGAAVAGLLGAIGWLLRGAARRAAAGDEQLTVGTAVAAAGIVVAWTLHTSVDWLHLIPGLSGGTLCAAACLAPVCGPRSERRPARRLLVVLGCGIAICLAASGIGRLTLAAGTRERAREALAADRDPRRAIDLAARSLRLQPQEVTALYTQAAGWARLGEYQRARDALLKASSLEPSNSVPRALLGDLAVRRGLPDVARREYAAAARLDPRDPGLRALAGGRAPR